MRVSYKESCNSQVILLLGGVPTSTIRRDWFELSLEAGINHSRSGLFQNRLAELDVPRERRRSILESGRCGKCIWTNEQAYSILSLMTLFHGVVGKWPIRIVPTNYAAPFTDSSRLTIGSGRSLINLRFSGYGEFVNWLGRITFTQEQCTLVSSILWE